MIKVLFTIGHIGTGGKERQLVTLINNLPRHKFEVSLLCDGGDAHFIQGVENRLKHIAVISAMNPNKFFSFVNKVTPHIVFCWSRPTACVALMHHLLSPNKYILINGSIRSAPVKRSIGALVNSCIYNLFDNVVANSQAGLNAFGQNSKRNRFILKNAVNTQPVSLNREEARFGINVSHEGFIISMVAGLKRTKDHRTLLLAAARLQKEDGNITIYIVGDGPTRNAILELINNLKLTNVVLLGNRTDIERIFQASDISVLCSTNGEGVPNSVLESLSLGIPVIATRGGGTDELIQDGKNGYLIDIGDCKRLAEKILLLKKNPEIRFRMSEEALKIREKYSVHRMIEVFENICDTVKDSRGNVPDTTFEEQVT